MTTYYSAVAASHEEPPPTSLLMQTNKLKCIHAADDDDADDDNITTTITNTATVMQQPNFCFDLSAFNRVHIHCVTSRYPPRWSGSRISLYTLCTVTEYNINNSHLGELEIRHPTQPELGHRSRHVCARMVWCERRANEKRNRPLPVSFKTTLYLMSSYSFLVGAIRLLSLPSPLIQSMSLDPIIIPHICRCLSTFFLNPVRRDLRSIIIIIVCLPA